MKKLTHMSMLLLAAFLCGAALADDYYEVTVTNVTKAMTFTPVMVASTRRGHTFFTRGQAASPELTILAETGNPMPLQASLDSFDVTNSGATLGPGQSVTQTIAARGKWRHISVAAMLIPSNDTFFAVNGIRGPKGKQTLVVSSPAYDAGSEGNDELCENLPGPGCGGPDPGDPSTPAGEGYVYISNGMRGIGNIDALQIDPEFIGNYEDLLDWRNPVAVIKIRRVKN